MDCADLFEKRLLLVTGKGGVGRSSVAASIALAAAKQNKSVLLAEFGDLDKNSSSLAKLFADVSISTMPAEVAPKTHAVHLSARTGHELFLSKTLRNATVAKFALQSKALANFLDAIPSLRELGVLAHLASFLSNTAKYSYDLVVVDMPASGHTLALAHLPSILLSIVSRGPFAKAIGAVKDFLEDKTKTAAVVVTLPKHLPVSESLELLDRLKSLGIPLGAVFINRMIDDPFTPMERDALEKALAGRNVVGSFSFADIKERRHQAERLHTLETGVVRLLPDLQLVGRELLSELAHRIAGARASA